MKFTEFEKIMYSQGAITLAQIARMLDTTPQAVSNWKARDQVPYHIVAKYKSGVVSNNPNVSSENKSNVSKEDSNWQSLSNPAASPMGLFKWIPANFVSNNSELYS